MAFLSGSCNGSLREGNYFQFMAFIFIYIYKEVCLPVKGEIQR